MRSVHAAVFTAAVAALVLAVATARPLSHRLNTPVATYHALMRHVNAPDSAARRRRLSHSDNTCTDVLQHYVDEFSADPTAVAACNALFRNGATSCSDTIEDSPLWFTNQVDAGSNCTGSCLPLLTEFARNASDANCVTENFFSLPCDASADCPGSEVCDEKQCVLACSNDDDCDCGKECASNGYCQPDAGFAWGYPGEMYATLSFVCSQDTSGTHDMYCQALVAENPVGGTGCKTEVPSHACCWGNYIDYVDECTEARTFPIGAANGQSLSDYQNSVSTECVPRPGGPPVPINGPCDSFVDLSETYCAAPNTTGAGVASTVATGAVAFATAAAVVLTL